MILFLLILVPISWFGNFGSDEVSTRIRDKIWNDKSCIVASEMEVLVFKTSVVDGDHIVITDMNFQHLAIKSVKRHLSCIVFLRFQKHVIVSKIYTH